MNGPDNIRGMGVALLLIGMLAMGCGGKSTGQDTSEGASPPADIPSTDGETAVSPGETPADSMPTCTADADCVPDACCHAKACIHASKATENCDDMMCTQDCVEGSMDCGKGACACQDGACTVKWRE